MEPGGRPTLLHRAVRAEPGEGPGLALSAGFFFCVLFGYFLLRPVREAMGVQRGMADLAWLFGITCAVSLGATMAFGGVVSRVDRRRAVAVVFRFVIACLLAFAAARWLLGERAGVWTGYAFYVWLSVVNLMLTSVFWAFMADAWSLEQGKRLFAAIGVGGTLGAVAGSAVATAWAGGLGPMGLMLCSCAAFEGAVWVMRGVGVRARGGGKRRAGGTPAPLAPAPLTHAPAAAAPSAPQGTIGGRWYEGVVTLARSPYLLGVGAYLVVMAVSNTLLYFTQARLVTDAEDELTARIALFGQLDLWTQVATLLVQVFVTSRLIRRAGVGVTLGVLPVVTAVGFAALALVSGGGYEAWQVFAVFAAFNAVHRATRYAIARPARETLFNVVPDAEKYKAKTVADVFLYRGGDVAGVGVERGLAAAGLAIGGVAMAVAPVAGLWLVLSLWLAREQSRRARAGERGESEDPGPEAALTEGAVA